MFSRLQIEKLEKAVRPFMSEKRYNHTLGVRKMAKLLAERYLPEMADAAEVAALLHDISKEMPLNDGIKELVECGFILTETDYITKGVIHSYTAPLAVKKYFPEYATCEILSAVLNHTVGAPDMSVLDEIVFLADFIEEGRSYERCVRLRETVLSAFQHEPTCEPEHELHFFVISSIDYMLSYFVSERIPINEKMILTRNALLSKI